MMTEQKKWNLRVVIWSIILIAIDQWTKYLAIVYLKGTEGISLLENVFKLYYLENRGAAFGMLQGQKWFFLIMAVLISVGIVFLFQRIPQEKKFIWLRMIGILLISGAAGNAIDRVMRNFVVDFLYFELIDFPIFNVADCYVSVGAAIMIILFLFYYKEEDLEFLTFKKKKED